MGDASPSFVAGAGLGEGPGCVDREMLRHPANIGSREIASAQAVAWMGFLAAKSHRLVRISASLPSQKGAGHSSSCWNTVIIELATSNQGGLLCFCCLARASASAYRS